jgi:glutamyl-tRNA reductase
VSIVVIGLNLRTAPLYVLERVAVSDDHLPKALHDLRQRPSIGEAAVLSTCHRVEVYALAERFHAGFAEVRDFLLSDAGVDYEVAGDTLYFHYDTDAAAHLFTVAAGLDSAVIGESEILGQVARAWDAARLEGATGAALNLMFRHAVEAGKRVRSETRIARGITSISQAAMAMATDRLGGLAGRRVLIVGAGAMGEQLVRIVASAGVADLAVANRTPDAAAALAARAGARAIPLAEVTSELAAVDLCITATGAAAPVLDSDDVAAAAVRRDGRPLLIVDMAMPRDLDPAAAAVPGVSVLDIEDVRAFVDANVHGRQREAERARLLLEEALDRYCAEATAREVAPLVAALRTQGEAVRRTELERIAGRLDGLDERQREAVEALTRGIVAKLLHDPTVRLKESAGTVRGERLAETLRELFDLSS